jgi:hypothetical protein
MGDSNQLTYLKKFMPTVNGPVVEIGSKDYGSTSCFRDFYPGTEYIGVDMEDGKGVEMVVDLTKGIGGLKKNHFALGICCSVMEHVDKPWLFADNMASLIRPNGKLYISVPWVWRYHAYPDDYFRYSWRGIMSLYPQFEWMHMHYSTYAPGEFIEIPAKGSTADNDMAIMQDGPNGKRKYLPYLMINMMGVKRS